MNITLNHKSYQSLPRQVAELFEGFCKELCKDKFPNDGGFLISLPCT